MKNQMKISSKNLFQLLLVFVVLLCDSYASEADHAIGGAPQIKCKENERQALLNFKQDLTDEFNLLSSWGSKEDQKDCCEWRGVYCDSRTGNVIKLLLHGSYNWSDASTYLEGNISHSLVELKHLEYLDLSQNHFHGGIPMFFGSFTSLKYLNLSNNVDFNGTIPQELRNCSSLQTLDLSRNSYLFMDNLEWLLPLQSLRNLHLSEVQLTKATDWLKSVSNLPLLQVLDLSGCNLPLATPSTSLPVLELKHLEYLDLSGNSFSGGIPVFVCSFTSLKHLDLSSNGFRGTIPHELRNLSSLQTLDLSRNIDLSVDNLEWLLPLQSLRNLHLSEVQLNKATDWLKSVSNLPLLEVLDLSQCMLPRVSPSLANTMNSSMSLSVINFFNNHLGSSIFTWLFNYSDSLTHIDLRMNSLEGTIPDDFAKMKSLVHLGLSDNRLDGGIPSYFGNYSALEHLDLAGNSISGPLPETIAKLSSLKFLSLMFNKLNGSMPKAIGQLPNLEALDLVGNEISGVMPDFLFCSSLRELYVAQNQLTGAPMKSIGCLSNLENLYLGSNHFEETVESHQLNFPRLTELDLSHMKLKFHQDWVPPFQLRSLKLRGCKMGPHFPKWLRTQTKINNIDMSDAGIFGDFPSWFRIHTSILNVFNLSYNSIHGTLPMFIIDGGIVDLSSNDFEGPIPHIQDADSVNLSKNRLTGKLHFDCNSSYGRLWYLDISDNQISGQLPNCWERFDSLVYLNLANNNFSGKIPPSLGSLSAIEVLQLRNNGFTGELPQLGNISFTLNFIDLGHNKLTGTIPSWIGDVPALIVLSLSSNRFKGDIPHQICGLQMLQILDLSANNISGAIPKCISWFPAMAQEGSSSLSIGRWMQSEKIMEFNISYVEEAFFIWKGRESPYKSTLGTVKIIDLSSNNLTGVIPSEVTDLVGLLGLNLSRNHLTGKIPPQIGRIKSLDVLDLSSNQLSGEIPSSLTQLGQLGMLNLSYNDFTGRIPPINHEASAFEGNPRLCGKPLEQTCPGDVVPPSPPFNLDEEEEEDKFITKGFYLSMALGFVFGFWGVCGFLFFNRSCRDSFFRALKEMGDWAYVTIALKLAKLQKWFQNEE